MTPTTCNEMTVYVLVGFVRFHTHMSDVTNTVIKIEDPTSNHSFSILFLFAWSRWTAAVVVVVGVNGGWPDWLGNSIQDKEINVYPKKR